jgi:FSR family fosmidomycin resistance protein-like MFS transporter
MHKFGLSIQDSQFHLFLFLASVAAGTLIGGPLGIVLDENTLFDIHFRGSLYVAFTMLICFGLVFCQWLSVSLLLRLFGNFSFAQELMPSGYDLDYFLVSLWHGRLGFCLLGYLADQTSIEYVYKISSYLPLIGIFTYFYPNESYFHLNLVLFMNIRGSFLIFD